eukprot:2690851-Heterocapsa_arctica.AAC.1
MQAAGPARPRRRCPPPPSAGLWSMADPGPSQLVSDVLPPRCSSFCVASAQGVPRGTCPRR